MTYNILIKAQGATKELFKFYQENGVTYSTTSLDSLTTMYNKLLETYPTTDVFPIHALTVTLNTSITENTATTTS